MSVQKTLRNKLIHYGPMSLKDSPEPLLKCRLSIHVLSVHNFLGIQKDNILKALACH